MSAARPELPYPYISKAKLRVKTSHRGNHLLMCRSFKAAIKCDKSGADVGLFSERIIHRS